MHIKGYVIDKSYHTKHLFFVCFFNKHPGPFREDSLGLVTKEMLVILGNTVFSAAPNIGNSP